MRKQGQLWKWPGIVGAAAVFAALLAGCPEKKGEAAQAPPEKKEDATADATKADKWKDTDVIIRAGADGPLTYADMKRIFLSWSADEKPLDSFDAAEQRKFFLKYYNERLFAAEARARGLQDTQSFHDRTLATRYRLLIPVYKQREIMDRHQPTDEELLQYIAPAQDEVQVRIIVKADAAEARRLYERATAGEDFSQLAKAESEGNLQAAGGLTGFLSVGSSRGKFPPPVIQRFLDAPVGSVLEPFYQDIGYLIVKIEAKRSGKDLRKQDLERSRSSLVFNIQKEHYERRVKELTAASTVVVHDDVVKAFEQGGGDPSVVLLEVNGEAFRASEIFGAMAQISHGGQPMRQRAEGFAETAIVGQEARRLGLDRDPLYLDKWALEEQRALAQELMRVELEPIEAAPVTDEDVADYRKARPEKLMDPEARRLRIIVLDQEAKAEEALAKLRGGADFVSLVREMSVDPRSRERDGDMNFLFARDLPEPIRDAVAALKVGQYTDPAVKAEAAESKTPVWIVARLEGVRDPAPTPPERAKTRKVENEIRTLKRTKQLKLLVVSVQKKLGYVLCIASAQTEGS